MGKGIYKRTKKLLELYRRNARKMGKSQKGKKHTFLQRRKFCLSKLQHRKLNHLGYYTTNVDGNGYMRACFPFYLGMNNVKREREHRVIIEYYLGRPIGKKEVAHHINENKIDNRPQNLMLFASKSAHIRFHYNPLKVKQYEIIFDGREME